MDPAGPGVIGACKPGKNAGTGTHCADWDGTKQAGFKTECRALMTAFSILVSLSVHSSVQLLHATGINGIVNSKSYGTVLPKEMIGIGGRERLSHHHATGQAHPLRWP